MKTSAKRYTVAIALFEIAVFIITTTVLAYLASKQDWETFGYASAVAIVLFASVVFFQTKPAVNYLNGLAEREKKWTNRMESLGLADLYNMQLVNEQNERNDDTRKALSESSNISLISATAASYIDPNVARHWPALKRRLDAGASLRLVLPSPASEHKLIRDLLNRGNERPDSKFSFENIINLHNNYPNAQIRFTRLNIYCAILLTDKDIFYDPYHLGKVNDRIENQFICMRIDRSASSNRGDSYSNILRSHFDFIWSKSEPIESYFENNHADIADEIIGLPDLARHRL